VAIRDDLTTWVALKSVDGIGSVAFRNLLAVYGSPARVFEAPLADLEQAAGLNHKTARNIKDFRDWDRARGEIARAEREGVSIVTCEDPGYPERLRRIYDPPPLLYIKGSLEGTDIPVAVVGSRNASPYGRYVTERLCRELAQRGVTIVSGLARGIDTCAHRGALSARGRTIAVMGCGIDVIYPPENELLAERILDAGGAVVSEYVPGAEPSKGNFPQRNRIISGLCAGVLLVEGAENSGAMITVNLATEQGRDVFAVPGSIYSPLSAAPNRLIQLGAPPALSGWDILEHYRWASRPAKPAPGAPLPELDEEESTLVTALREQELSFDELCSLGKFPAAKLNSLLTMLVLRGIIVKAPGGLYRAYQ